MTDPNFTILYVANPAASAVFYGKLLHKTPVQTTPTFVLFALDNGTMLGLWGVDGVKPAAQPAGGSELAFALPDDAAVRQRHAAWSDWGLPMLQAPTTMDFGFTFLAADPDGHRLRVFAPAGA